MKRIEFFKKDKINRVEYLIWGILVAQIAIPLTLLGLLTLTPENNLILVFGILMIIFLLAILAFYIGASTKRIKDIGINKNYILLAIVPYINFAFCLYLLFKKGSDDKIKKENKFINQ